MNCNGCESRGGICEASYLVGAEAATHQCSKCDEHLCDHCLAGTECFKTDDGLHVSKGQDS